MPFSKFVNIESNQLGERNSTDEHLTCESIIKNASESGHKRLKSVVRRLGLSASHPARKVIWPLLISTRCGVTISSSDDDFLQDGVGTDGPIPTVSDESSDLAGYELSDNFLLPVFYLNDDGRLCLRNILHSIAQNHPEIVYAPQLWPIVALFLHYHSVPVSRACILALLNHGHTLIQTKAEWKEQCLALECLGRMKFSSKAVRRYFKTQSSIFTGSPALDSDSLKLAVAQWAFMIWRLPFEYLVRVMDCFIVEGPKVLYRVGLMLLHIAVKRQSANLGTSEGIDLNKAVSLSSITPASFLKRMFSITGFSRTDIDIASRTVRDTKGMCDNSILENLLVHPCNKHNSSTYAAYLSPTESYVHPSECVNISELSSLVQSIGDERLSKLSKPVLVFSTNRDGTSLQTLYSMASSSPSSSTILLVRTASGKHVLGAFCTDRWQAFNRPVYFGTGLCFLFRIRPRPLAIHRWVGLRNSNTTESAMNSAAETRFQCATMDGFHIGGSGISGQPGLSIDARLSTGTTGPSPTFNNPRLVLEDSDVLEYFGPNREACAFRINLIELLGFVDI